MEIILPAITQVLNSLITSGQATILIVLLFVAIGILVYALDHTLGYKVLCKQMSRYRELIQPIIEEVKVEYAYAIQAEIKACRLTLTHEQVGDILPRHADLVEACFMKGERYTRERLTENHIVKPSDLTCLNEGCASCTEPACRGWREFCKNTFEAHSTNIWEPFVIGYSTTFFPISIQDRKKAYLKKVPGLYKEWCKMLAAMSAISRARWMLK